MRNGLFQSLSVVYAALGNCCSPSLCSPAFYHCLFANLISAFAACDEQLFTGPGDERSTLPGYSLYLSPGVCQGKSIKASQFKPLPAPSTDNKSQKVSTRPSETFQNDSQKNSPGSLKVNIPWYPLGFLQLHLPKESEFP